MALGAGDILIHDMLLIGTCFDMGLNIRTRAIVCQCKESLIELGIKEGGVGAGAKI